MVPQEGFPLPVNVLGQAGHGGVGVFAHLVHGVTWETGTAPLGLEVGKRTADTSQILSVLKQPHTVLNWGNLSKTTKALTHKYKMTRI